MTTVDQVAPIEPAASAPMPAASRLIGAIAVGVALLSATATFLVLAGLTPIAPVHEVVKASCCSATSSPGSLLLAIIGREVWVVVQARRRGRAGSRLHVQIVGLFAVIAAVPAVLVAVVASDDARPRPRPLLLDAHARHDRAVADRGQRLCERARPDRSAARFWRWPTTSAAPSRCSTRTAINSGNS